MLQHFHNTFIFRPKKPNLNPKFLTRSKNGLTRDSTLFFASQADSTYDSNHFLKLFFGQKNKIKTILV